MTQTLTVAIEQIFAIASAEFARPREVAQELDNLSHMVVVLAISILLRFRGEQEIGCEQFKDLRAMKGKRLSVRISDRAGYEPDRASRRRSSGVDIKEAKKGATIGQRC